MKATTERIAVALSGGVDSSVTADLLLNDGHELFALHMVVDPEATMDGPAVMAAREVARRLDIPIQIIDARKAFKSHVLEHCWSESTSGRTPNPCVLCNRFIKFGLLLGHAEKGGARTIATGHYARITKGEGGPFVARGADVGKDQSYFLARVSTTALQRVVFPLGGMTKPEVLAYARSRGLDDIVTPQSQDVCFVSSGDSFGKVLAARVAGIPTPGRIVDTDSRIIGAHEGIHLFTRGQRRGVGVAMGERAWVHSLDTETGDVMMTRNPDDLLDSRFDIDQIDWRWPKPPESATWKVQTRYRQRPIECTVEPLRPIPEDHRSSGGISITDTTRVCPKTPIRAITPGQLAVFYANDMIVGSGRIKTVI